MMRRSLLAAGLVITLLLFLAVVVIWFALPHGGDQAAPAPSAASASAAPASPAALPPPLANTPTPPPSPTGSPTAAASATSLPAPSPTGSPMTAAPTVTTAAPAAPAPTAVPSAAPSPDWLAYLNLIRAQAGLPPVVENPDLSAAAGLHSRYMTYTGQLVHGEDPASPYFTNAGLAAGMNGNIAATNIGLPPFSWAFNYWVSAAFHAVPMLDPRLLSVGFGEFRDASAPVPVTATLDVKTGLGALPPGVHYPIMFPRDGGYTWVLRYGLPEFPDALAGCHGYVQPSGPPIILQLGPGDQTPAVTGVHLSDGTAALPACEFDATNYFNPDPRVQKTARGILAARSAVVVIPQASFAPGKTISVQVDVNGASYRWSFTTGRLPH